MKTDRENHPFSPRDVTDNGYAAALTELTVDAKDLDDQMTRIARAKL